MKIHSTEASIVIAGAWNPAIVTPTWIAQNILGYAKDKEFKVQVQMPVQGIGVIPRLAFEDLTIHAQPDSLVFMVDAERGDQVKKTIDVARRTLELLVHTPVSGIGINLLYSLDSIGDPLASVFRTGETIGPFTGDDDCEVLQQAYKSTLRTKSHLVNIEAAKVGQEARVSFNHHFECSSATAAAQILTDTEIFARLRQLSESVVSALEKVNA